MCIRTKGEKDYLVEIGEKIYKMNKVKINHEVSSFLSKEWY